MTAANVFGRRSLTALFMCFTLSLAAQEETFGKSETFGCDKRMCDVLVNIKLDGDDKSMLVPGTIVGRDDDGRWKINFPYETDLLKEKHGRITREKLSQQAYDASAIQTNMRFLNDDDLATLDEEDRKSCDLLLQHEKEFSETEEFGPEGVALWKKLLPILFERFTTINAKERSKGIKLTINHLRTKKFPWHTDYRDMGFTMLIDDSFEGSPLIFWPGKNPLTLKDPQKVSGNTLSKKDLEKEAKPVSKYPVNLPCSEDPNKRTHADMEAWAEKNKMKIAPAGTRITLFEGSKTMHGRPLIPKGHRSARGLGFYEKPQCIETPKALDSTRKSQFKDLFSKVKPKMFPGMRPKQ